MGNVTVLEHTPKQIALVKHTIAKDCNDDEFNLFMEAARSYGLDPFRKQIMPLVFGKNARDQSKRRMSIVVSRDGLRVIAQRCKNYRPASDPAEVVFNEELKSDTNPKGIEYARVYLWQQDNKGEWFKVVGEAYWDEFAPLKDEWIDNPDTGRGEKTGRQTLDTSGNWAKMPVVMITKCAEAQALRAGWPDQFSGIYVEEELDRAKTLDLTASEIVAHNEQEERAKRIGAHNAITITWGDGWQLENVPVGEFADRAADFIRTSKPEDVRRWQDANKQPLQAFWAKAPSDAFELKKIIEAKLADKPAHKTGRLHNVERSYSDDMGRRSLLPGFPYWAARADRQFVVGETYKIVEHHDRSENSHNHFFAAVKNGFDNLPDDLRGEYPTVEHLRKKALIRCGYRNERDIVLASKADAERVAAFMRPADEYSIVFNVDCVVREWTAKSQKKSAMDAREFQKSKQHVLDFIARLLGVQTEDLARSAA